MLALYATGPDMVTIGTGVDEKRIGMADRRAQLERDFAQIKEISIDIDWYSVSAAGSVAWVASDVIAQGKVGKQETSVPIRSDLRVRATRWQAADCALTCISTSCQASRGRVMANKVVVRQFA